MMRFIMYRPVLPVTLVDFLSFAEIRPDFLIVCVKSLYPRIDLTAIGDMPISPNFARLRFQEHRKQQLDGQLGEIAPASQADIVCAGASSPERLWCLTMEVTGQRTDSGLLFRRRVAHMIVPA
jgi:hypothetical protein